ncbi:unnamed protein product [Durusdinium trenchii]|uniref:Tetratricopeptide repeat protein 38 n=1 Tax=Durusdinium trenchii TaxID=1381693 RepID=A0ABP0SRP6_9DINO
MLLCRTTASRAIRSLKQRVEAKSLHIPRGMFSLRICSGSSARVTWRMRQPLRPFSMLQQLPDYAKGSQALAEGRFMEALPMLRRSVEVADAYFPADAGSELAECHASLGSCLWHTGEFEEAARQFTAKGLSEPLLLAGALVLFELGRFDEAANLTSSLACTDFSVKQYAAALRSALQAVTGSGEEPVADDLSKEAASILKFNALIKDIVKDEGVVSSVALSSDLVGELDGSTGVMLRCTLGELAVLQGLRDDWVEECLVKTLKHFDQLHSEDPFGEAKDPFGQATVFRALTALATWTNANGDAITAEGLFTSARDRAARHTYPGRANIWRSGVAHAFATMLETGRHAEQRAPEIRQLRERCGATGPSCADRRWALLVVPSPVEVVK